MLLSVVLLALVAGCGGSTTPEEGSSCLGSSAGEIEEWVRANKDQLDENINLTEVAGMVSEICSAAKEVHEGQGFTEGLLQAAALGAERENPDPHVDSGRVASEIVRELSQEEATFESVECPPGGLEEGSELECFVRAEGGKALVMNATKTADGIHAKSGELLGIVPPIQGGVTETSEGHPAVQHSESRPEVEGNTPEVTSEPVRAAKAAVQATLRNHFDEIIDGRYGQAFRDLTKAEGDSLGGEAKWVADQKEAGLTESRLDAKVRFDGMYALAKVAAFRTDSAASGCQEWSGSWGLVESGHRWLIENAELEPHPC